MLTRFNLGSIPSTAKSTLGLKIKMVRPHQICHDSFFWHFWGAEQDIEECLESIIFLVICASQTGSLISAKEGQWCIFGAWKGNNFNSQSAGVDSLLRGQAS
jgi:hypothetical protein